MAIRLLSIEQTSPRSVVATVDEDGQRDEIPICLAEGGTWRAWKVELTPALEAFEARHPLGTKALVKQVALALLGEQPLPVELQLR